MERQIDSGGKMFVEKQCNALAGTERDGYTTYQAAGQTVPLHVER